VYHCPILQTADYSGILVQIPTQVNGYQHMQKFVELLNTIVWNSPAALPVMIALLVGTGMFMTIRLGFIQIRYIGHAINAVRGKYDTESDSGEISHFQALATALSGTIGIGNIAGVATAIHYGGPGALFWMWVTGVFGTSLKFANCQHAFRKLQ